MQRTNIFIASSSEMHHERLEIVDLLTDMCSDTMRYVPVKWEYMDSAVHQEHKQTEYIRRLQKCEICIVMFWRSLGEYTEKELLLALDEQSKGKNPQRTYVLFKEDGESIKPELKEFKDKLVQQHGDIVYSFSNNQELRVITKALVYSANVKCKEDNWNGKEMKVMIAADEELDEEKLEFTELIAHLNEVLESRGIRLHREKWTPHGADDFREKLLECGMCLNLYWTKMPEQADEEMNTAYDLSTSASNPLHLYVFFKEPSENISMALADFKAEFETQYGHFFCKFENADTLNLHFILQFEASQHLVEVSNSMVTVGGVPFINFANVSFAANNESYCQLCNDIDKQKFRLVKHPDDLEEQKELHFLLAKRETMEENMLDVAKQLSKESLNKMSPRMEEARLLFESGELGAVIKILNTDLIVSDIQTSKRHIDILKEQEKREENQIEQSISDFILRVKAEKILCREGWTNNIIADFILIINETRNYASPFSFANLLLEAARFIEDYSPDYSAVSYYHECINTIEKIERLSSIELIAYGDMLYFAGRFFSEAVFDIDYDPTEGEWMTPEREKTHAIVMKRWKEYRNRAKKYLQKSIEIFHTLNESNKYDVDIYYSLKELTNYQLWDGNYNGERLSIEKWISFTRNSTLSQIFLLSALIDYAIKLHSILVVYGKCEMEYHATIKECNDIVEQLDPLQLEDLNLLRNLTYLFQMDDDISRASSYCRKALKKLEELSKEDPFSYNKSIAGYLVQLAEYVSWDTDNYKINPEAYEMLDKAERIYENLYKSTGSDVYYSRSSRINGIRFGFRLRERMDYGEHVFNAIFKELKDFLSSHITSGKHSYVVKIFDSPIKNIGIWIKKIRNRDEYKLLFTWEIDEWSVSSCSMGRFRRGTKDEIYQYLISQECYDTLKENIIRDLYKSWNMD